MQKGALIKVHILILLWRDYVDNEFFLLCVYEYNGLIVTWKTFFFISRIFCAIVLPKIGVTKFNSVLSNVEFFFVCIRLAIVNLAITYKPSIRVNTH
jgi:hypothetical protein